MLRLHDINLADRLKETCGLAQAELLEGQEVKKSYDDKKAKLRTVHPGQKCLVRFLLLTINCWHSGRDLMRYWSACPS